MDYNQLVFNLSQIEEEGSMNYSFPDMSKSDVEKSPQTTNPKKTPDDKVQIGQRVFMDANIEPTLMENSGTGTTADRVESSSMMKSEKFKRHVLMDPNIEPTLMEDSESDNIADCIRTSLIGTPFIEKENTTGLFHEFGSKKRKSEEKQEEGSMNYSFPDMSKSDVEKSPQTTNPKKIPDDKVQIGQRVFMDANIEPTLMENSRTGTTKDCVESSSMMKGEKFRRHVLMDPNFEPTLMEESKSDNIADDIGTALIGTSFEHNLEAKQNKFDVSQSQQEIKKQQLIESLTQQIAVLGEELNEKKQLIDKLEEQLCDAHAEIDSFEELEDKMFYENFQLKKELLKLKCRFELISVEEACRELGCCASDILDEIKLSSP